METDESIDGSTGPVEGKPDEASCNGPGDTGREGMDSDKAGAGAPGGSDAGSELLEGWSYLVAIFGAGFIAFALVSSAVCHFTRALGESGYPVYLISISPVDIIAGLPAFCACLFLAVLSCYLVGRGWRRLEGVRWKGLLDWLRSSFGSTDSDGSELKKKRSSLIIGIIIGMICVIFCVKFIVFYLIPVIVLFWIGINPPKQKDRRVFYILLGFAAPTIPSGLILLGIYAIQVLSDLGANLLVGAILIALVLAMVACFTDNGAKEALSIVFSRSRNNPVLSALGLIAFFLLVAVVVGYFEAGATSIAGDFGYNSQYVAKRESDNVEYDILDVFNGSEAVVSSSGDESGEGRTYWRVDLSDGWRICERRDDSNDGGSASGRSTAPLRCWKGRGNG